MEDRHCLILTSLLNTTNRHTDKNVSHFHCSTVQGQVQMLQEMGEKRREQEMEPACPSLHLSVPWHGRKGTVYKCIQGYTSAESGVVSTAGKKKKSVLCMSSQSCYIRPLFKFLGEETLLYSLTYCPVKFCHLPHVVVHAYNLSTGVDEASLRLPRLYMAIQPQDR